MPTHADVRRFALALPEAYEAPHFEATSFRVNKKIFCTMGENGAGIVLKFTPEDQHNLAADEADSIKPVAGYWGRSGWTDVQVSEMAEPKLQSLLRMSWAMVAPKRLLK
jgi:predicted DNA-binding protein (MmcQ/YjbR family)